MQRQILSVLVLPQFVIMSGVYKDVGQQTNVLQRNAWETQPTLHKNKIAPAVDISVDAMVVWCIEQEFVREE